MSSAAIPWCHWVDEQHDVGCVGVAEVKTSDGRHIVGDLWRIPGCHMELLPLGEAPFIMSWLDVISIRLLNPAEAQQVLVDWRGNAKQRRRPRRTGIPQAHQPPGEGAGWLRLS